MTGEIVAIVPAAGVGERARAAGRDAVLPKQYGLLHGEPMLRWAVRALLADDRIAQVRVVVAPGDGLAQEALTGLPRTVLRACGGPTRAATVQAALEDLDAGEGVWALVHDAARPGLPLEDLRRLIDACLACGAGGLLARRVADTVKRQHAAAPLGMRRPGGRSHLDVAARTVPRDGLWLAQTPQMFPARALLHALRAVAGPGGVTDEASAMEHAGHAPLLVPGSQRNFKVTWPEDFTLMEKWLAP